MQEAIQGYIALGILEADEVDFVNNYLADDEYYTLTLQPIFFTRRLAKIEEGKKHGIVYAGTCDSFGLGQTFIDSNKVRNYIGFDGKLWYGLGQGQEAASAIFDNMAGVKNDNGGIYANQPLEQLIPIAQEAMEGYFLSPNIILNKEPVAPNAGNMRLYNAPRIVIADVKQDQDSNDIFEHLVYNFIIGGGIYPYNPASNTNYPSGGITEKDIATEGKLKVTLRFSEPMDKDFENFHVNLIGSDGAIINIPSTDVNWTSVNFPNNTWIGTVDIPDNFPDGETKVAIRAKRASASELDIYYQELDLIGTGGPTLNTEDKSINFILDRKGPKITYLNPEETPRFTCEDEVCGEPEIEHILWSPSKFTIDDLSEINTLSIYKDNFGELLQTKHYTDTKTAEETFTFVEGSSYTMVATDILEQSTTMYFMADAFRPYAKKVIIKNKDTQETYYEAEWQLEGTALKLKPLINKSFELDTTYRVNIFFSEQLSTATLSVAGADISLNLEVSDGSYTSNDLYIPSDAPYGKYTLSIYSKDLADTENLKANSGVTEIDTEQITRDASGSMRGTPGQDESHQVRVGEDGIPPTITWYDIGSGREGAITGENTLYTAPWLISRSTPIYNISDDDSGLKFFNLYQGENPIEDILSIEFPTNVNYASLYPYIQEDTTGYKLNVIDQMINGTTMYFHVDRVEPKITFNDINVYPSGDYFNADVSGTMEDKTSGIGLSVDKQLNPSLPLTEYANYAGPTYPVGEQISTFTFSGLDGGTGQTPEGITENTYLFIGADRSNQIGIEELWMFNQDETAKLGFENEKSDIPLWLAASGMKIKNASLIITGDTVEMLEGCTLLDPIEGRTILVKAIERDEIYPDEIYWDNIPLNLSYFASTNEDLLRYSDEGLIDTSNDVYMTQLTSITVTQTGNTNEVGYRCMEEGVEVDSGTYIPGSIFYKGTVTVNVAWTDIMSPIIMEEEWVPAGFNIALNFEKVDILVERVLKGGKISFARAAYNPDIPGLKLADANWVYDISVAAEYEGQINLNFHVDMSNFTAEQIAGMTIYHKEVDQWVEVASSVGEDTISCQVAHTSPFAIMVPMNDYIAPQTELEAAGEMYVTAQGVYLPADKNIILTAEDITDGTSEISGVATTYYLIDNAPTQECLLTPFDINAVAGTCANPIYTAPFMLAEGIHSLYYFSVDNRDNYETGKSTTVFIDGTKPITTLIAGGSELEAGTTAYITETDSITLTAIDHVVNGVASNVKWTGYKIDAEGEETLYTEPFTLSLGTHTVYYKSGDNVENEEEMKSVYFVNASTSLMILSASPSSGPIGMPFTINGFNFGTYSSGKTNVLIGGTTAPLTLWNDTQIKGTIPGTLEAGDYDVKVQIIDGETTTVSNTLNFTLTNPVLSALAPSSGPIGLPFIIDGESFGNYSSGKTIVLIGGTTAPLTLWNDTQIKGTVPGTIGSGEHSVIVERNINGGLVQTSSGTFTLTAPQAYSLNPSSGPIGLPFVIEGESFGNYSSGKTTVLIGGTTAALTLWTNTQIKGTIPGTIDSGNHSVIVERNINDGLVQTSPLAFELTAPQTYSISPTSGPIGTPFTIEGESFGNYSSGKTNVLIGDTTALLTLWTNTQIKGKMPGALVPGTYDVVVEREINGGLIQTSPITFILNVPEITGVNPSSGPIGNPFTVSGVNFDSYSSQNTRILIGGTTAPLTLWSDTQVKGTIPGTLAPGDYEIALEREVSGAIVRASTYPFTVLSMVAFSLQPSSGPIGLPFTIDGESFGTYSSGKTTVLIGGTTAPLTLWTNTQIKGTIPGTLESGNHSVIVERNINGGLVQTSSMTFTLTIPQAYSLNPSSGPIGLPFVIEGESFGNYSSGKTNVLIGGTTAPLTLWTNTQIKGTIPGTLETGNYPVIVERNINDGLIQTSPLSFEIISPQINSISPDVAAIGAPFVLTGTGFGNYSSGKTRVLVGGLTAPLTLWTDSQIKGRLPFLLEGEYPVIMQREINDGLVSVSTSIAVAELTASSMTPTSGAGGTSFKIYGEHFGPYDSRLINGERASRVKIGGLSASLSYWNDSQINGLIPDEIAYGTQTVIVERATEDGTASSNSLEFYVPEGTFASFSITAPQEAELIVQAESGGYVESAGRSAVEVPEEALEEETVITIESDKPTEAETEKRDKAMKNKYLKAVGPAIGYGPHGLQFSKKAELKLPYTPDEVPTGKTSEDLAIYRWNEETSEWEKLESEAEWTLARLKAKTEHFSVYQVMAEGVMPLALADFKAGEHYVFPNPSKTNATFHFECGTADNAQVTIYDVSGHKIHNADITSGFTTINGKYTYRYSWNISKQTSGVYIYILKANKGGSYIIRKGKMAIVK
jgi:IPT/TIG domain/Secretion system C-terminal sorting domain